MPEIKDLTGQTFGRLKVERFSHLDKHHKGHWLCRCECGATVTHPAISVNPMQQIR